MNLRKYYHPPDFIDFCVLFLGTCYINYHYNVFPSDFYKHWKPISYYTFLNGPLDSLTLSFTRVGWTLFACLAGLGFLRIPFALIGCLFAMINLGHNYNFGNVYHSYTLYMGSLLLLAFGPLMNSKSKDFSWIDWSMKIFVVFVMTLTGLQKLYYGGGSEWALSDAFYVRIAVNPYSSPLAKIVLDSPLFVSQLFAFYALFIIELLSPLALFNKRIGLLYFFFWSSFHLGVTLLFGNHYLFYSQIFVYSVFLQDTKAEYFFVRARSKVEEFYYRLGIFKK
jgi:hypothetical protein